MAEERPKQEELLDIDYAPPAKSWMEPSVEFRPGTYGYNTPAKHLEYLELANPRDWGPTDDNWKLPENWEDIILQSMLLPHPIRPGCMIMSPKKSSRK